MMINDENRERLRKRFCEMYLKDGEVLHECPDYPGTYVTNSGKVVTAKRYFMFKKVERQGGSTIVQLFEGHGKYVKVRVGMLVVNAYFPDRDINEFKVVFKDSNMKNPRCENLGIIDTKNGIIYEYNSSKDAFEKKPKIVRK